MMAEAIKRAEEGCIETQASIANFLSSMHKHVEKESQEVRHGNQPFVRWLVTDSSY